MWSVDNGGYGWSSTSYTSDHCRGGYLDFGVTGLDPSSTTGRACGFQLRCLSE
ncbi:hypothetical protein [uncultured Rikenella sp.]|uniref:hypothetical protein n=1 Tax=uncultured Rikenella sp. TaxID=368003 RepID=UPI00261F6D47|nr:hypothetical protein [uncultured Rikenella sp.]